MTRRNRIPFSFFIDLSDQLFHKRHVIKSCPCHDLDQKVLGVAEIFFKDSGSSSETRSALTVLSVHGVDVDTERHRTDVHPDLILKLCDTEILSRKILIELGHECSGRQLFEAEIGKREVCIYINDAVGSYRMIQYSDPVDLSDFSSDKLGLFINIFDIQLRNSRQSFFAVRRFLPCGERGI